MNENLERLSNEHEFKVEFTFYGYRCRDKETGEILIYWGDSLSSPIECGEAVNKVLVAFD